MLASFTARVFVRHRTVPGRQGARGVEGPAVAREWNCPRCSTKNSEESLTCAACGTIRGSVVATPRAGLPSAPSAAILEADGHVPGDVEATGPAPEQPVADAGSATVPPAPSRRRIPIGWIVVVALIGAGVVGGFIFNASRSSSGEIVKSGDLVVSDLRVGDCFDLKDPTAEVTEKVLARPCAEEHEYELFYVGSLPEGPYPSDGVASFEAFVRDNCAPAFASYVGKAYEESELEVFWFYPSTDAWSGADRSVQCAVYHPRIHRLTESLKGSSR